MRETIQSIQSEVWLQWLMQTPIGQNTSLPYKKMGKTIVEAFRGFILVHAWIVHCYSHPFAQQTVLTNRRKSSSENAWSAFLADIWTSQTTTATGQQCWYRAAHDEYKYETESTSCVKRKGPQLVFYNIYFCMQGFLQDLHVGPGSLGANISANFFVTSLWNMIGDCRSQRISSRLFKRKTLNVLEGALSGNDDGSFLLLPTGKQKVTRHFHRGLSLHVATQYFWHKATYLFSSAGFACDPSFLMYNSTTFDDNYDAGSGGWWTIGTHPVPLNCGVFEKDISACHRVAALVFWSTTSLCFQTFYGPIHTGRADANASKWNLQLLSMDVFTLYGCKQHQRICGENLSACV